MSSMPRPIWSTPSSGNRRRSKSWQRAAKRLAPATSRCGESAHWTYQRRRTSSSSVLAVSRKALRMTTMTAGEVRDRLDQRFRLLVGSRRGLERHQTLRHAVQWSYDLLAEEERVVLERCSVFAGGFDLQSACAIAGLTDDFAAID